MSDFILGRTKKLASDTDEQCLKEVVRAIERELTTLRASVGDIGVFAGPHGSQLEVAYETELIVIPVGSGSGGVDSLADLVPAGSTVVAFAARVTTAPGGGATTFDAGRKAGGNTDEFVDGAACTSAGQTANGYADNDATEFPILNATADKVTITTNLDVTDSDMYLRVVLWYLSVTPPTS